MRTSLFGRKEYKTQPKNTVDERVNEPHLEWDAAHQTRDQDGRLLKAWMMLLSAIAPNCDHCIRPHRVLLSGIWLLEATNLANPMSLDWIRRTKRVSPKIGVHASQTGSHWLKRRFE